jgi:hypothetical protein
MRAEPEGETGVGETAKYAKRRERGIFSGQFGRVSRQINRIGRGVKAFRLLIQMVIWVHEGEICECEQTIRNGK